MLGPGPAARAAVSGTPRLLQHAGQAELLHHPRDHSMGDVQQGGRLG